MQERASHSTSSSHGGRAPSPAPAPLTRRLNACAILLILLSASLTGSPLYFFRILTPEPSGWSAILSSLGLTPDPAATDVVVIPSGANAPVDEWTRRVEHGTILILEGASPLAASFGFRPRSTEDAAPVSIQSIEDLRAPSLRIVWEKPLDLPPFEIPRTARVFARDRRTLTPLMAGCRTGSGAILWIAAPAGERGYERFPYIPQALADLGLEPPFRSARLWAFFDSSYRSRVDPDYFAERWRAAGIGALHVAAWHFWERDPASDEYLRRLIDACHRHAILVYAWFEFPHVSEQFWDQHPQWREKTALLQDAQLDWRKLMNLANPDAAASVNEGMRDLLTTFDWDGANLAELYFESLEGHDNPARLTPMNGEIRAEFRRASGFDPLELFNDQSPRYWTRNASGLKRFLDYRADLARRQQEQWIARFETIRESKPHLDLALTYIDDRFDATMHDKLGADTSRVLPLLARHDFTFLIEDPATVWNLGPSRYPQIAAKYSPATPSQEKLAIDINVVDRYQDVYPTKQQTGTELFELVHAASGAFPRVALYFENSIARIDWPLLASSAAPVDRVQQADGKLIVDSRRGLQALWKGPALVDGKLWPVAGGSAILVPAGMHTIEPASADPPIRVVDFNGDLRSAKSEAGAIEFAYQSSSRALARLDRTPGQIEIDGAPVQLRMHGDVLVLPRGQHIVTVKASPDLAHP